MPLGGVEPFPDATNWAQGPRGGVLAMSRSSTLADTM